MKRWSRGVWVLLAIGLSACSSIRFDDPMPLSAKPVKEFAPEIQGKYQLINRVLGNKKEPLYNGLYYEKLPALDSFHIIRAYIVIEKDLLHKFVKTKSYYKMRGADTARLSKEYIGAVKILEGDFVVYEDMSNDTLLNLQKKDELKFYNKTWYLNHSMKPADGEESYNGTGEAKGYGWEILQLVMKNKDAFSINITNEKDKRKLRRFIVSPKDNFMPQVRLSDARFYRFVKWGGFRDRFQFKRMDAAASLSD